MKMSRQRLEQIVARIDAYQETALRSTGKGSYRVRLRNNITTHMDLSDLPVLGARDRVDGKRRAAILAVVRSYTLAFFDRYLRGMKVELLDEPVTSEFVEAVQKFAPTKSPCASQKKDESGRSFKRLINQKLSGYLRRVRVLTQTSQGHRLLTRGKK